MKVSVDIKVILSLIVGMIIGLYVCRFMNPKKEKETFGNESQETCLKSSCAMTDDKKERMTKFCSAMGGQLNACNETGIRCENYRPYKGIDSKILSCSF